MMMEKNINKPANSAASRLLPAISPAQTGEGSWSAHKRRRSKQLAEVREQEEDARDEEPMPPQPRPLSSSLAPPPQHTAAEAALPELIGARCPASVSASLPSSVAMPAPAAVRASNNKPSLPLPLTLLLPVVLLLLLSGDSGSNHNNHTCSNLSPLGDDDCSQQLTSSRTWLSDRLRTLVLLVGAHAAHAAVTVPSPSSSSSSSSTINATLAAGTPIALAWSKQTAASQGGVSNLQLGPKLQRQQQQLTLNFAQQAAMAAAAAALAANGNKTSTQLALSSPTAANSAGPAAAAGSSSAAGVGGEFGDPRAQSSGGVHNAGHEITNILKAFFTSGYDKRVRPNYSGPPALVNVSFHIIGISSVSEVQMDFTTDFYFRQKWFDPRLEFKPVGQINELCVGAEFAEKIWLPDTFFANEKTATFHKATTENTFIRVKHNGRVYRSIRLTVTCSCPMDLQYFPMDRQRCKIEIESYGYNTRDIDYRWENGNESVSLDGKIELPQFKVLGFKMGHELQSLSSGDYIRLYCEIHFVRSMGYYLIQIYIPASLIVIISWVSFWLHRNATPARVALGVTTVLTMTTLMSSTNAALPKISYIKSIDVFLGTCFVMVFASLLEYASVGYIGKRIAMKRKRQQDLKQMQQHHQRVCVAAAASAAAAAAAAQQTNPVGVAPAFLKQQLFVSSAAADTTTQNNGTGTEKQYQSSGNNGDKPSALSGGGHRTHDLYGTTNNRPPILVRRFTATAQQQPPLDSTLTTTQVDNPAAQSQPQHQQPPSYGQRSTLKIILDPHSRQHAHSLGTGAGLAVGDQVAPAGPLASKSSLIAQHQPPVAEFEQQQQQQSAGGGGKEKEADTVRICGLTPSAIDKYSRVVFPICFVCFNLMYWIIYGHISQQIDDHGPPLIPFVRS